MSYSESSGIYDDHDPFEYEPAVEIFTSDSDSDPEKDLDFMLDDNDLDDFQPFALPDRADDDVPLVDDVLALPPQHHDQIITRHPEGEHIVEIIPFPPFLLTAIPYEDWPFCHHPDEDLDDGEVFDVTILEVASPIVSVVDISSDSDSDSRESVTSSTLRAVGLEAYPTDDASSVGPATPTPPPPSSPTPPASPPPPTHIPADGLASRVLTLEQKVGFLL
ncbi:hypothetical protein Hanom_Chr07g00612131 [Helianthus anomalus]